jgi:hypothetical protein
VLPAAADGDRQPERRSSSNSSEHPFAAKGLAGWVGGRLRPDLDRVGRHGRGGQRRVPPVLNERPRYITVTVATRSSRARRECPHDVLTVLRLGRLHGAGADCGHDDLRYFLGVGDHDNM